jgi:quercetin dioxygenase-like cupin family protein
MADLERRGYVEHESWLDLAERFNFAPLEDEELRQFEAHLSSGCALCDRRLREAEEVILQMARSLQPVAAPADAKTRVFEQIGDAGYRFVHSGEGEWRQIAPAIFAKVLSTDPVRQRVTALVRMEPGSRYDNHRHASAEEIFVLEGSCYCAGRLLRAGDYHRAEAGSLHLDTRTDEGSLMLVMSSNRNEMLA